MIGIGVFAIAFAGLALVYFQQISEQRKLNEQLSLAQSRLKLINLEELSSRQTELESRLEQVSSQSKAVKAILSQPVGSVVANSILFDLAQTHGLEVIEVTSSTPTTDELGGIICSVVSMTAKVEGNVASLIKFIANLNDFLMTGTVRSTVITIPEAGSGENPVLDIRLVVYTYRGD